MNNNEAYIFAGHGHEVSGSFTVPKGHIIIVISHSGDTIGHDQSRYKAVLDNDNRKYILDPLNNIDKLTELLGVFAIYKGNDDPDPRKHEQCPKIYHSTWHTHAKDTTVCKDINSEAIWPSGIIKLTSSTKLYNNKDIFLNYLDKGLCINNVVSQIYDEDVRKEAIKNIEEGLKLDPDLLSLWRSFVSLDENKELTSYNLIKSFIQRYRNILIISQEDFCNSHVVEDGKYTISYALNCRNIHGSKKDQVNEEDRRGILGRNLDGSIYNGKNFRKNNAAEYIVRSNLGLTDVQGDIIQHILETYNNNDIDSKYYRDVHYILTVHEIIDSRVKLNKNNIDYLYRLKNQLIIFIKILTEKNKNVNNPDIHSTEVSVNEKANNILNNANIDLTRMYTTINSPTQSYIIQIKGFIEEIDMYIEEIHMIEDRYKAGLGWPIRQIRHNPFLNPVSKQISEAFKQRRNSAQAYIQNRTKKNERKQNIYRVLNKKENTRNNVNRKKLNDFRKDFPEVENDYIIDRTRNATNANLNTINTKNLTKRLNRLETLSRKRLNNNSVKYGIKKVTRALEKKQSMNNMRAMEV